MRLTYFITLVFFIVFCREVLSQETNINSHAKILGLVIQTNKIPKTFYTKLNCRIGKECSYQQINSDIHNLMKLGCFENVIITLIKTNSGIFIKYKFIDSPIVSFWSNSIYNCSLKPSKKLFATKAGKYYNPSDWFDDRLKIKDFYRKNNYHNIKIKSHSHRDKKKIALYSEVYPGEKQFVEKINVLGNNLTEDEKSDIISLMHCRPRNLWLFRRGIFSSDKFKDDKEKIINYFINKGFLDANADVTLKNSSKPNRVVININVVKGPQYRFGKIIWNQQLLSTENFKILKEKFKFPSNTAYTPKLPEMIRDIINKYCIKFSPLQPYLSIMPIVSESSEPNYPIINIIVTLRKNRIGIQNFDYKTLSFSYPASLAGDYLNK